MVSLYWHDYETWGEDPGLDRPSQFAGLRTDLELDPVGEPLVVYCQPVADLLPKPEACLVTGLTPQMAAQKGVSEPEFMAQIHAQFSRPGTCGLGYNSLRFDDEVTRYGFYRNFFDPYEREWRDGNSRWDIIDMLRLARAVRPQGIKWPDHDDGRPSFKLEHLTAANGIGHEDAHDALSDVLATIAMARLVKERQPQLFLHLFELRRKQAVCRLIDLRTRKPLLHVSSHLSPQHCYTSIVSPLAEHPVNRNAIIFCDLQADPQPLLTWSADRIRERLYTPGSELEPGEQRIPLKLVHINKCPVLATVKLLDASASRRLNIDTARCEAHWQQIRNADLREKMQRVFAVSHLTKSTDPERQLYDGFISDADKRVCEQVRGAKPSQLAGLSRKFSDARLPELLFRYRARHFPDTLDGNERQRWETWRHARLTDPEAGGSIVLAEFGRRLASLRESPQLNAHQQAILDSLVEYAAGLLAPG